MSGTSNYVELPLSSCRLYSVGSNSSLDPLNVKNVQGPGLGLELSPKSPPEGLGQMLPD